MASSGRLDDAHLRSRCESPWQQVVFGLFSLCCLGVEALWVTGSGAVVSVTVGLAYVVGERCPPAYCSSRLPVFYDFYKKLTELSANKLACCFCWLLEHSYQSQ